MALARGGAFEGRSGLLDVCGPCSIHALPGDVHRSEFMALEIGDHFLGRSGCLSSSSCTAPMHPSGLQSNICWAHGTAAGHLGESREQHAQLVIVKALLGPENLLLIDHIVQYRQVVSHGVDVDNLMQRIQILDVRVE